MNNDSAYLEWYARGNLHPRWIPVSERLPEDGVWVLVYVHGDIGLAWVKHYSDLPEDVWYGLGEGFRLVDDAPTHWMPLPPKPEV